MKKLILCASVVCMGMLSSCQKDELVPADSKPEWLGASIYEELQNGTKLDGTFSTYLRLVKDLGYDEVLSRTGSVTIFPANDEAFNRFFSEPNAFGVQSYEQLTEGMKKQLLYSSMLNNAMLSSMLSNVKADDNNVSRGVALKHASSISATDSITTLFNSSTMPKGNTYWQPYYAKGINVVYDGSTPMIVHFTREQMLNNGITTLGADCDFGILRGESKGTNVENSDVPYIFQTPVVKQDITCQNGYIHQVKDVVVPPGNMAQVLRSESNTKLFSRILDYHCAPYYNAAITNSYNSWALQNNRPTIDSIFQVRYFTGSSRSYGASANVVDPSGNSIPATQRLNWDPGWNEYYPSSQSSLALADMGAMFVPTDEAVAKYFLEGGGGSYFVDNYGATRNGVHIPNTRENLEENLDSIFVNGNGILTSFVNNLMQGSFIASVPSKFGTITQAGSGEFMGLQIKDLARKGDKYDICVANNGVIYKLDEMVVPDEYRSVLGPTLIYPELSLMNQFASDRTSGATASHFGADLYYYLMAMKSKYGFFIPVNTTDGVNKAFKQPIIDPVSLASSSPRAIEFYYYDRVIDVTSGRTQRTFLAKFYKFNKATGEIDATPYAEQTTNIDVANSPLGSQVKDLLQGHTLVLDATDSIGDNNYYLTMNGAAIRLDNFKRTENNGAVTYTGTVRGGAQIDNNVTPATITRGWREKNGWSFQIDGVIQPSITSVNKLLNDNQDRFSKFLELCSIFDNTELLEWAGIKGSVEVGTAPQERYIVFSAKGEKAIDLNVNFFNGYNYTFYAPDNAALDQAYESGLPTNDQIMAIYDKYYGEEDNYSSDEITENKALVLNMLNALRAFVRYHFQNNAVFADKNVSKRSNQSMYSSELGIPVNITSQSTGGVMTVSDAAGKTVTIDANDGSKLSNKMTRDYELNTKSSSATSIAVSSTAIVHQISSPLCYTTSGRYDAAWRTASARKQAAKNYATLVKLSNK